MTKDMECERVTVNQEESTRQLRKLLPFFPAGAEDETLFSRIGVYHILSGHKTTRETYQELFHVAPFPLTYWIPPYIDRLACQLPGNPKENLWRLYKEGTLSPLFQLFSNPTGQNFYAGSCSDIRSPRRIVGESGTTRVCIECLAQDATDYGIPFIHRAHQIPATTVCWKHQTRLIDRCPICLCPIDASQEFTLTPWRGCVCGKRIIDTSAARKTKKPSEFENSFARFGKELLEAALPISLDSDSLTGVYRQRIAQLGYCRGSRIRRADFRNALVEHVSQDFLRDVDYAYRNGRSVEWGYALNPRTASETPLTRHLILAYFLFRDAGLFIAATTARAAAATASIPRPQTPRRCNSDLGLSTDNYFERAMERLLVRARENGLVVEDLWKVEYGTMKKLVRWNSNAVRMIETRLNRPSPANSRSTATSMASQMAYVEIDSKWAAAIETVAKRLYDNDDKPKRITTNQLLVATGMRPKIWPTTDKFPNTCLMCEKFSESPWHFYARKLLWTMRRIPIDSVGKKSIARTAGIHSAKASDVIQYFIDKEYRPTTEHPMTQLRQLGIQRDWAGPQPNRHYEQAGRAYIKKDGLTVGKTERERIRA